MSVSVPLKAALRGRCGICSQGKLFGGFLKLKSKCDHCGQDFTVADTADGPAFFVGFFIMIVLAPFYFILPVAQISIAAKVIGYGVILAATVSLAYWLLPLAKAALFNLQIHHRAEQAQFEDQAPNY
jgi:uncharacterized protein (DUF983 family)